MTHHTHHSSDHSAKRAWVVFSGQTDLPWLRVLRKGFRHCSVILQDNGQWVTLDPMAHRTEVCVHPVAADFDLPAWFERRGLIVIPVSVQKPLREAPWGLFTCVEAVKRVLGIHERFVLTPWQLFCHLRRMNAPADRTIAARHSLPFAQPEGEFAWEV
jgi:hypothetical protein